MCTNLDKPSFLFSIGNFQQMAIRTEEDDFVSKEDDFGKATLADEEMVRNKTSMSAGTLQC